MKQRQPRRPEAPAVNGSREQITVGHSIGTLKKSETGMESHESRVRRRRGSGLYMGEIARRDPQPSAVDCRLGAATFGKRGDDDCSLEVLNERSRG